jgi:hypothetical protein
MAMLNNQMVNHAKSAKKNIFAGEVRFFPGKIMHFFHI